MLFFFRVVFGTLGVALGKVITACPAWCVSDGLLNGQQLVRVGTNSRQGAGDKNQVVQRGGSATAFAPCRRSAHAPCRGRLCRRSQSPGKAIRTARPLYLGQSLKQMILRLVEGAFAPPPPQKKTEHDFELPLAEVT
jgi:hypothetical protein